MRTKKFAWALALICFFICYFGLSYYGFSQPGSPGDGEDPDVPITGIEWLLLGGGVLGAKMLYRKTAKK